MKYNRQSEIIALINENEIEKQDELSERLREKGYMVTQATISRDIRELGLIKVTGSTGKYKYALPRREQVPINSKFRNLLIETVTSIRNLQPMLAGARDAADGMPVLVSFVVDDKGDLLGDGLNIEAAVLYAEKHGASSVGVNCCSLAAANAAVPRMVASATTPVTVRPNVGDPVQTQDGPVWHENPEAFARACIEWRHAGAAMVGSCCGTTAITTAAMAEALDI